MAIISNLDAVKKNLSNLGALFPKLREEDRHYDHYHRLGLILGNYLHNGAGVHHYVASIKTATDDLQKAVMFKDKWTAHDSDRVVRFFVDRQRVEKLISLEFADELAPLVSQYLPS